MINLMVVRHSHVPIIDLLQCTSLEKRQICSTYNSKMMRVFHITLIKYNNAFNINSIVELYIGCNWCMHGFISAYNSIQFCFAFNHDHMLALSCMPHVGWLAKPS